MRNPVLILDGADMTHLSDEENKHIAGLIQGIKVAMLTTLGVDGSLRSRPMASLEAEFDGTLWFFTNAESLKVDDVQHEHHVNVSYVDCEEHRYVSISGRATLIQERQKLEDMWSPILNAWFPLGLSDPQLILLKVQADTWEYWDCQIATMVAPDRHKLAPSVELVVEPEVLRKGDLGDTWVTQDVGTKKTRNATI